MNIYKRKNCITGEVVVDAKTKDLVKRLEQNKIAILQHNQLDGVAAKDLIRKNPLAVINFRSSVTSVIPSRGAALLLRAGIMLIDVVSNHSLFNGIKDGMKVEIFLRERTIVYPEIQQTARIMPITLQYAKQNQDLAESNFNHIFQNFLNNTLQYAMLERNVFVDSFPALSLKTDLYKKNVIIVTRGPDAFEDFATITPFIQRLNPVLIGVDGGADIILMHGMRPHIVIGDMDSVSDESLTVIPDRIIHSYPSGKTPGLLRLASMNLDYQLLPFIGTSEDVAILLAYEHAVEKIILVGSHTHMLDFLEKGREGMASTIITRMKVGHLIIDVKGIHALINDTL